MVLCHLSDTIIKAYPSLALSEGNLLSNNMGIRLEEKTLQQKQARGFINIFQPEGNWEEKTFKLNFFLRKKVSPSW